VWSPSFHLVAQGGAEFDIEMLQAALEMNRSVFRHPGRETMTYVVCASPEAAAYVRRKLQADPAAPFDTSGMVLLDRQAISVFLPGLEAIHEQIETLLLPVLKQYACKIFTDIGDDLTEEYCAHPEKLFRHDM